MSVSKRAAGMMLLGAMAACRAVVGIEDQTIATDAGAKDGGADGATTDATTTGDAGTDAATKPPPVAACLDAGGIGPCQGCCREQNKQGNPQFDTYLRQECICQKAARCAAQCATFCGGGDPGLPGNPCLNCITENALQPVCANALARCDQDSTCAATSRCMRGTCQ